jgi:hypothetical protein
MGVAAAMLLMTGALFWWKGAGRAADPIPPAPAARVEAEGADPSVALPPTASARTREEKRFGRYDKDKNGSIARAEYLASRQKAFAKLDLNGDGRLSFEEYSAKAIAKFTTADADKSGVLSPAEFATTRVVRKERPKVKCPRAAAPVEREDEG